VDVNIKGYFKHADPNVMQTVDGWMRRM